MVLLWINISDRLHNGVSFINNLTRERFQLLLSHIVKNAEKEEIFTEKELKTLEESLKLNEANLQLLIQSLTYIFKQSCKVILKPTVLQKQLTEELKFQQEKADEFVKIWSSETNKELGDFSEHKKLENVSWELNVQSATNLCRKQTVPNARIHLNISGTTGQNSDKVSLELNEHELLRFYNTLETIQSKLDVINKKQ